MPSQNVSGPKRPQVVILSPALIAGSTLKKVRTVRPKRSNYPKQDALSAKILVFINFKRKSLQNPRTVRNETLFHWLTKGKRKQKYNDLRKEHSRSPNKSLGQKSSAELWEQVFVN